MRKLSILFTICLLFFLSQTAFGQNKWAVYENARFGYSIAYPSDLLAPQPEADNGDGRAFRNKTASMQVFGMNMLLGETLRGEFDRIVEDYENVSYKIFRNNFFVVSGIDEGNIYYQKIIERKDGTFISFYIQYPQNKRAVYDKITAKIADSFK